MRRWFLAAIVCAGVFAAATTGETLADGMPKTGIVVEQAWARASAGPAKAGAAYVTVSNAGAAEDRLIEVQSDVAARSELHTHLMDGGVMKMRRVDGVDVAPGTPLAMQPGGLHIMFSGLKKPFVEGEKLSLTLVFKNAGRVDVEVDVLGVGAGGPDTGGSARRPHMHGS